MTAWCVPSLLDLALQQQTRSARGGEVELEEATKMGKKILNAFLNNKYLYNHIISVSPAFDNLEKVIFQILDKLVLVRQLHNRRGVVEFAVSFWF